MNKTSMIYVHIPFCVKKCDYCDFTSFVCDEDTKSRYFESLFKQIDTESESVGKLPIDSVFIGGGTPSCVNEKYIYKLSEKLKDRFDVKGGAEFTIECNPGSVTKEKLSVYKEAGINRISIGLQSTDNSELKLLSRVHDYEGFLRTYDLVRGAGFGNVNIDIMSALPTQTRSSYKKTLECVVSLKPEHISAYSLIVEEGTPFYERYKDGKGLPGEDVDREMYHDTKAFLKENGYERYEISNYAKTGFEFKHNTGYWTRKPYLGFGLAAASFFNEERSTMHSDLRRYIEGDHEKEVEKISKEDAMAEFMFLGLRLTKGVSKKAFEEVFSLCIYDVYGKEIEELTKEGLIIDGKEVLYLTDFGLDVSNVAMAKFLK
ncbi:MAG: oxygen-independent coproporphyrinogen III oxidase [Lachnospiraceae bacterium]|nr:oxygen-independent coproporphyrinogen III oxidase [Lachnospiraceae bacterium]